MKHIKLLTIRTLAFSLLFLTFSFSFVSASTISIKLVNYIGNQSEVDVKVEGNYKIENSNIRYSGANRFMVANNIADSVWETSDTVFIVNRDAYADALSATPLAYKKDAPILLTNQSSLTEGTIEQLTRLNPDEVFIIGGTVSVSDEVMNELKTLAPNVTRIGGSDRYEVSKNIAELLDPSNKAIVTNGMAFADALAIAPYASVNEIPILLTKNDRLPDYTLDVLNNKSEVLVVGGEVSISKEVYDQLPGTAGETKQRIGGKDRYEVSANIVNQLNLDASEVFLSNGNTFADALTGSVVAAKNNRPLLLTKSDRLPDIINQVINEKNTKSFTILGGPVSISKELENQLPNELTLNENTNYKVKVVNGRIGLYNGSTRLKDFGTSNFSLIPEVYNTSNSIAINNRDYLGKIEFKVENGFVRPYNMDIPFDDYLKGVVPAEMPASWEMEALKSQSVAARTYAYNRIGTTIDDTQGFQVYRGFEWHSRTNTAIDSTKGEIITLNGRSIGTNAVFTASNGGFTESSLNIWGSNISYLPAIADEFDTAFAGWNIPLRKQQINLNNLNLKEPEKWWNSVNEVDQSTLNNFRNHIIKNYHPGSQIKIVSINKISPLGDSISPSVRSKNTRIELDYIVKHQHGFDKLSNGDIKIHTFNETIQTNPLRTLLGTMNMKSTYIRVEEDESTITIVGNGFGHGVGMSQYGAQSRAKAGQSYSQILQFYYPGISISKLY